MLQTSDVLVVCAGGGPGVADLRRDCGLLRCHPAAHFGLHSHLVVGGRAPCVHLPRVHLRAKAVVDGAWAMHLRGVWHARSRLVAFQSRPHHALRRLSLYDYLRP